MQYLKNYLKNRDPKNQSLAAISYLAAVDHLHKKAPKIAQSIVEELKGQRSHLKLIASENYSSLDVQLAMGNLLTDKYAEGYAGHRFYAGCENVDVCEEEAMHHVKSIFNCDHAYVQPHSGADANLVAFWAVIVHKVQSSKLASMGKKRLEELSDEEYETLRKHLVDCKMMGLSLDAGGHLTHGYRHNISSKMMRSVTYSIDPKTETLDYQAIREQAKKEKPTILLAGYSAYSRRINFAKMREIADEVGAVLMVDMAHFSGLVAGKVFQGEEDPIPYADIVTSTTHKTLRGPRGGFIMCKQEYAETVNKGCPLVLGGPLPHVIAAKAIAFQEANTGSFQKYAHRIVENAKVLAECFLKEGLRIISGGTDNHLMVLDVSSYKITGRQAEEALLSCGICLNRNAILNDTNGPWYTSGVRIGTPALTTLGMGVDEMKVVAKNIIKVLKNTKPAWNSKKEAPSLAKFELDSSVKEAVKSEVFHLLQTFPLYPELALE
ncbi:MAG: Serine hydroxymethyltransferase [Chlamydiae bacterium]|nr:Serine hydroxymethyltransferase [Chlamydiota bacterium]